MPRVLFGFRKEEAALTHAAANKKKVKNRRFGGLLLHRKTTKDDLHYGDMTSIMTHLGTSSETVSSSEPAQEEPASPSSFRISILEVKHENKEMMMVSASSSSLGSAPPSVARALSSGNSSARHGNRNGVPAAAAAKQRFHQHQHHRHQQLLLPPSPPTCHNVAARRAVDDGVQRTPRTISFHIENPSEELPQSQPDQPSPVRNYILRRRVSVVPPMGPLCNWLPNSSDAAALTTGEEVPQPKFDKHVSFSSTSSSPPRLPSPSVNHESNHTAAPERQTTIIRDEYDFDIYKARNSLSLTDNIYHHDYLAPNHRDYFRRAIQFAEASPPMAAQLRPHDQRHHSQKKNAEDDDDDTVGGDSLGMIMGTIGLGEHSIFAANATATANHISPYERNNSTVVQIHSSARSSAAGEEKKHDSDSEESIVFFSNDHHFQPPAIMTRAVTEPAPLPASITPPGHDDASKTPITRQDESSPKNHTGLVRFSNRILCYGGSGGGPSSDAAAAADDDDAAASVSSALQEPPSLSGCLGGPRCKSTNSEEGSLVTKSTVGSGGGGEDFSMYREMQDLLYDVTFFCRCMSDAFLSDEQGAGGQNNKASSSIQDSNPSVVELGGGGEIIVHTTKRITSALKLNPQYSPPRRNAAAVTMAVESPERIHSGYDQEDGNGSRGGGTLASSPSSQSHRSSSTGGSYSYIAYNDDDDDSTDASSCRTSPSMYS